VLPSEDIMKRSTTYLLATCSGLVLAACGPKANDSSTGGAGAETGATSGTGSSYDSTSATTPGGGMSSDSTAQSTTIPSDTGVAGRDTTAR
jgi:hypothetical protein